MKNIDKPCLSYGKALYSIEIVSESLDVANNFHETDKCQAASFWLKESVFSMSEHRIDLTENAPELEANDKIFSITVPVSNKKGR